MIRLVIDHVDGHFVVMLSIRISIFIESYIPDIQTLSFEQGVGRRPRRWASYLFSSY